MIKFIPYPASNLLGTHVSGTEYDYAVKAASNMYCSGKQSEWGRGYMNTKEDPQKVERNGRLGEVAFAKFMHCDIQAEYIRGGDDYDFLIEGKKINVKTSFGSKDQYRIIKTDDRSIEYKVNCDYYFFLYSEYDNRETRDSLIRIDGFITGNDLRNGKFRVGESLGQRLAWNWEIPYKALQPFENYYKETWKCFMR